MIILVQKTFEAGKYDGCTTKRELTEGQKPYYNCPYCRNKLTVMSGKGGIVCDLRKTKVNVMV